MNKIEDAAFNPLLDVINVRVRPDYRASFREYLTKNNIRFDNSDDVFPYINLYGEEVKVSPFIIYDFNQDVREKIIAWDEYP